MSTSLDAVSRAKAGRKDALRLAPVVYIALAHDPRVVMERIDHKDLRRRPRSDNGCYIEEAGLTRNKLKRSDPVRQVKPLGEVVRGGREHAFYRSRLLLLVRDYASLHGASSYEMVESACACRQEKD